MLVSQVVAPKHPEDAAVAQQALRAASVRMPDREACAAELATALEKSPASTKSTLLEILSEVGGTTALQTLAAAAKSNDPQLQDTSSRLLGKWNSVDAAPVLLDLAKTAPAEKYQVRALRGYIGLARKFAMPERAASRDVPEGAGDFTSSRRAEAGAGRAATPSEHRGAEAGHQRQTGSAIKDEATAATLVIAQKLGEKGIDVSALMARAGLDKVKLEIIKAEYGAGLNTKGRDRNHSQTGW